MNKYLLFGIVPILVAIGGWLYFIQSNAQTSTEIVPENSNTISIAGPQMTKNWSSSDFSWQVVDLGPDEYNRPHHQLVLQVAGSRYTVGDYPMDCNRAENKPTVMSPALPGELLRHYCSYGGGEWSIVVVKENDRYVVKSAYTTEENPTVLVANKFNTILEVK